ncbi:MAG: acyl carrier protein [Xanthomonadales bacterium]|nr:acyl carrier protein [Xanthomonadales bacterium]
MFSDDESALADDTSLVRGGLVDSTGILELIMFLETTLGIKVPPEDMTPDNFDTVLAIDAYVGRRMATA